MRAAVTTALILQFDPSQRNEMSVDPGFDDDLLAVFHDVNARAGTLPPIDPTTPPRAVIARPLGGAVLAADQAISVFAHASGYARVVRVDLYVDGALVTSATQPAYELAWTPCAGDHVLVVEATDENGRTARSSEVHVSAR